MSENKTLACCFGDAIGALGGTRTPNLLIRSKVRLVQGRPALSISPAGTCRTGSAVPVSSPLIQTRC